MAGNSDDPFRVIFVCMGNICRSPAGENLMNAVIRKAGLEDRIVCDSAGTIDDHTGNPPDPRMLAAATSRGYAFTGAARQVDAADLQDNDLIVAMDRANRRDLLTLDQSGRYRDKIVMFTRYCQGPPAPPEDVPDPYYGGQEGFDRVLDLLEDGCQGLLAEIVKRLD